MHCPKCKYSDTQVLDSRDTGAEIRRRRECLSCNYRFTTYERIEKPLMIVTKKNGDEQRFDAEKIRKGIVISCKNRPVSSIQVEALVNEVEEQLFIENVDRVTSRHIGDLVCERLEKLDKIAYLRFTSVCQAFNNINQFSKEIKEITQSRRESS